MLENRKPISVEEAVKKVMQFHITSEVEWVSIHNCDGRFLGEDICATMDLPRFTRAAFDGYAVRSIDTELASMESPVEFEVLEDIGAGTVPTKSVGKNQTVRIMTGAQMPIECDSIIPIEVIRENEKENKRFAVIKQKAMQGDHVSYQGEEAKQGDKLINKGTKINVGIIAILATFGYAEVPVAKKPKVGILATGSELLEVDEPMEDGKIRNSNALMVVAQVKKIGGEPIYFGKLSDNFETSFEKIKDSLAQVHILITTGGVSVGDYDLMPDIYKALHADVLFNKVRMRPGSVTTVAQLNGKLLFGLSGNPSACFVGLELFLRPAIRNALFATKPHLRKEKAVIAVDFFKRDAFERFVRSRLFFENGMIKVAPSGTDNSNIVTSLIDANCLMYLQSNIRELEKGNTVDVLLIEDSEGSEWPWTNLSI